MPIQAFVKGRAALLLSVLILLVAVHGVARAQVLGLDGPGVRYVEAASLAVSMGDVATVDGEVLTWRGVQGVVTFFLGSSVALLQAPGSGGPDEHSLSATVRTIQASELARLSMQLPDHPAAGWLLPLDAVQLLGVANDEVGGLSLLHLPNGATTGVQLPTPVADTPRAAYGASWEAAEIGGSPALRIYASDRLSLLLLDLDLAPLAFPDATAVVDAAAARIGVDHALLLVVSALDETAWESRLVFEQDGRVLEVRHPYRLRVYRGSAEVVTPDQAAAAVVMLPVSFSLYRPLKVTWAGVEATVTFRR